MRTLLSGPVTSDAFGHWTLAGVDSLVLPACLPGLGEGGGAGSEGRWGLGWQREGDR